jgi:hypothetical protein
MALKRVPTWCPFRLQFYFNGHNRLATALDKAGIEYELVDNAFVAIADFEKAQQLADGLDARELHHVLDRIARTYCPVIKGFGIDYHFSVMQIEHSTDIIFRNRMALEPLYEQLVRTAIHSVKPEQVATFLGRRLTANVSAELGNDFNQPSAISSQVSARVSRHPSNDADATTPARSATTT